jgi:hypothetical protein
LPVIIGIISGAKLSASHVERGGAEPYAQWCGTRRRGALSPRCSARDAQLEDPRVTPGDGRRAQRPGPALTVAPDHWQVAEIV